MKNSLEKLIKISRGKIRDWKKARQLEDQSRKFNIQIIEVSEIEDVETGENYWQTI